MTTGIWKHPGGKLLELGVEALSDAELLAILIGTGVKDRPADVIAGELLAKFGSLRAMYSRPLTDFLSKGMGVAKIVKLAAALEIARRIGSQ